MKSKSNKSGFGKANTLNANLASESAASWQIAGKAGGQLAGGGAGKAASDRRDRPAERLLGLLALPGATTRCEGDEVNVFASRKGVTLCVGMAGKTAALSLIASGLAAFSDGGSRLGLTEAGRSRSKRLEHAAAHRRADDPLAAVTPFRAQHGHIAAKTIADKTIADKTIADKTVAAGFSDAKPVFGRMAAAKSGSVKSGSAKSGSAKPSSAKPAAFAPAVEPREVPASGAILMNESESPLLRLFRRKGSDGCSLIGPSAFAAGERLRRDFTLAQLTPRVTANWSAPASGGRGASEASDTSLAAGQRLRHALDAVGPEFSGLLLDLCCFLKGLSEIERERGWPIRSAKLVARLALDGLARHYGLSDTAMGAARARPLRHWGTPDYRPEL